MSNKDKSKLNVTLAWAKPTRVGFWSEDIGAKQFDAISQIEVGGRLSLRKVQCKNKQTGEPFDGFVFEYITPDQVKGMKSKPGPKGPKQEPVEDTDY